MTSRETDHAENNDAEFDRTREMPASLLAAALEKTPPRELPDDALIAPAPTETGGRRRVSRSARFWWAALGLVLGIPLLLTLAGALTSPPHVGGVPHGLLVYLEAETPSDHTTTLRGLYAAAPGQPARLLVHESEPQDTDSGVREWITQPVLSPDGTHLAYEKQLITLQEEAQGIENQIWVMPLTPDRAHPPHLVIDLTKSKLKQVVGLAWDSDSSLLFLQDGFQYSVPTDTDDAAIRVPLDLHGLSLALTPEVSATHSPALSEGGSFAYSAQTPAGPQVLVQNAGRLTPGPAAAVFALSPSGDRIAFVPLGDRGSVIHTFQLAANTYGPDIPVRWGWSVFGRRRITALHWSPDGTQIAFTVRKPPVPDDEIFTVDLASGKTVQLPYRTGPAAWDWGR